MPATVVDSVFEKHKKLKPEVFKVGSAIVKIDDQPVGLVQNVNYTVTYQTENLILLGDYQHVPFNARSGFVTITARQLAVVTEMLKYIQAPRDSHNLTLEFVEKAPENAKTKKSFLKSVNNVRLTQAVLTSDSNGILIFKDVVFEGVLTEPSAITQAFVKSNQTPGTPASANDVYGEVESVILSLEPDATLAVGVSISFSQPVNRVVNLTGKELLGFQIGPKSLMISIRRLIKVTEKAPTSAQLLNIKSLTTTQNNTTTNQDPLIVKLVKSFKTFIVRNASVIYDSNGLIVYKEVLLEGVP